MLWVREGGHLIEHTEPIGMNYIGEAFKEGLALISYLHIQFVVGNGQDVFHSVPIRHHLLRSSRYQLNRLARSFYLYVRIIIVYKKKVKRLPCPMTKFIK